MKFIENIEENNIIPSYDVCEDDFTLGKPSHRIFETKKGKKAIEALENIKQNHNNSWYHELLLVGKKHWNETALFYRTNKITFAEMYNNADNMAKSLAKAGVVKGDEIAACVANIPEVVYLMLAANKIGAKLNLFGAKFNPQYIENILDSCSNKVFIATDDVYGNIKNIVKTRKYDHKVIFSLTDSLPKHPEESEEYEPSLDKYYHYTNYVNSYKTNDSEIESYDEFIKFGEDYDKSIEDSNNLETEFLITYTSGSTKIGLPKAMIHSNRSLITSGIFHQPELSGNPELKGLRGLAHIHTDSNTNVITCISDNLMQGWSVALEPEYDKDKFLDYLFINKPNYVNATTSFFVNAAKQYLAEKRFGNRKMPFLFASFAVGEKTSKGEEKFLNKFLRKARAGSGVKIGAFSFAYTPISIGGGDCEHGGIYYTLWKSMMEKMNFMKLGKNPIGMLPEAYVQVTSLNPYTLEECDYNQYGVIVANSFTNMVGYKNNKEATKNLILTDNHGRDWLSSNVYGYIDKLGSVHVKGRFGNELRLDNGKLVPLFKIEDIIESDTKNILSCTVVKVVEGNTEIPVINVELQPYKQKSTATIMRQIDNRLNALLPDVKVNAVYRIINNNESFPLTASGKRSFKELEDMKLDNTFRINQYGFETVTVEKSKVYQKV